MGVEFEGDVEIQVGPVKVKFTGKKPQAGAEIRSCLNRLSATLQEPADWSQGSQSPTAQKIRGDLEVLKQLLQDILD